VHPETSFAICASSSIAVIYSLQKSSSHRKDAKSAKGKN
jgi:hypothetical protein